MSFNTGLVAFKLAFQLSPIVLVNGIAQNIPGQMLPIIAITQAAQFVAGLLSGGEDIGLNDFFANFQPLPGATLVDFQIAKYPFANQAVAANATIAQPLQLSMLMKCPARDELGYAAKLATMMALQSVLSQHGSQGGTYIIVTPSYFYTNGILTGMRDASNGESKQAQNAWQMDFEFPLLTLEQAQQSQGSLMSKITSGTQINGAPAWSGLSPAVGQTGANTLAAPSLIPAASGASAAGTAPLIPVQSSPLAAP